MCFVCGWVGTRVAGSEPSEELTIGPHRHVHTGLRCSRTVPCERCSKLSLRCEPPESFSLTRQTAVDTAGVASPMLALAFRTVDAAKMAQCFVNVFLASLARGEIDRGAAQILLRTYRSRSRMFGFDYTFGAADAMAQAVGLTSVDLEAPREIAYEPPPLRDGAAGGVGGGGIGFPSSLAGGSTAF